MNSYLKRKLGLFRSVSASTLLLMSLPVLAQSVNVDSRLLATAQGTFSVPVFSPDGQSILYLDQTGGGSTTELYSLSIDGGEPTVLNTSLVAGGNIFEFAVTPDGQSIVYK